MIFNLWQPWINFSTKAISEFPNMAELAKKFIMKNKKTVK